MYKNPQEIRAQTYDFSALIDLSHNNKDIFSSIML